MTPALPAVLVTAAAAKPADAATSADNAAGFTALLLPLLGAAQSAAPGQATAATPAHAAAQDALTQLASGRKTDDASSDPATARPATDASRLAAALLSALTHADASPARTPPAKPAGKLAAEASETTSADAATPIIAPGGDAAPTDLSALLLAALGTPAAEAAVQVPKADSGAIAQIPRSTGPAAAPGLPRQRELPTLPQATGEAMHKSPVAAAIAAGLLKDEAAPPAANLASERPAVIVQVPTAALNAAADPTRNHVDFAPRETVDTAHVRVQVPVSDPGWGAAVGERLALAVGQGGEGRHRAELRLDPPELGSVSVHIELKGDRASLNFVATSESVRDALTQALPELRSALASQGLTLAHADIGSNPQAQAQQSQNAADSGAAEAAAEPEPAPLRALRRGLVDDYA